MTSTENDIQFINGNPRMLLISPHGHPKDDENTAELTLAAARHLNCQAIVNRVYRKPRGADLPDFDSMRLNLNKSDQAGLHSGFLDAIRAIAESTRKTLVIWVHGIKDENIRAEASRTAAYEGNPDQLLVLAGFGQGRSPKTGVSRHRHTAYPETCKRIIGLLTAHRLTTIAVRADAPTYRGRHEDYMNQWFLQNGYPLTSVESIQLEFKFTGVRDASSLDSASQAFAAALKNL